MSYNRTQVVLKRAACCGHLGLEWENKDKETRILCQKQRLVLILPYRKTSRQKVNPSRHLLDVFLLKYQPLLTKVKTFEEVKRH